MTRLRMRTRLHASLSRLLFSRCVKRGQKRKKDGRFAVRDGMGYISGELHDRLVVMKDALRVVAWRRGAFQ